MNYHSTRTAASKSPAISFAARSQAEIALFRPFCAPTKGAGCRIPGKRILSMVWQSNPPKPAARLAANGMVHPLARRRAATAFFRREKGSKTRRSPAASGMRPAAPPTPPNRLSKSPFLLMQPACASRLSPLTPAAAPPSPRRGFTRLPRCPPPKSSRRNPCTAARHTASPDRPG